MKPPRQIETDRLVLRVPSLSDVQVIFSSYARDNEITRYLTWRPHQSPQETERFVSGCIAAWNGDTRFPYVMELKKSDEVIGMIELRLNAFKADVGYVVSRPHWGKGLATEALQQLVDWSFEQESIYRVWAFCDVDNKASARVLEKVGMVREGLLRRQLVHPNLSDEPRDCYCYAAVK